MKTLYFDCFSGISGDMTAAALLDLNIEGADLAYLRGALASLDLDGEHIHIDAHPAASGGIAGLSFRVSSHAHGEGHDHEHGHGHDDDHDHSHIHRTYADIIKILDSAPIGAPSSIFMMSAYVRCMWLWS